MKNLLLYLAMVLFIFGFLSCDKMNNLNNTDSATLNSNLKAAVTEVLSTKVDQISTQDVQSISIENYNGFGDAIRYNPVKSGGDMMHFRIPHLSPCATVTVSDSVFPKEIVIDYGTSCADRHNHNISGKIIIDISDSLNKPGAVKSVQFQNFTMDSVKVEYTATIKNLGLNTDGNMVMQSNSTQVMTLANGTVLNEKNDETITWISGFATPAKEDDKFYKSGSGSLSINDTLKYSRSITAPLLYDRSCEFIVRGTVDLYKNGSNVVIDYGNGNCDNIATVTTNGTTEQINLKSHEFGDKGMFGKHCRGFGNKGY